MTPVVCAIALRVWLADVHPICDGDGRTARALFDASVVHQGDWLFEVLFIPSAINKARDQSEPSFLLTESDNNLTDDLLAQVEVIQRAISSLHADLERKAGELGALRQRLEGIEGLNHRQLALLRHALRHSGFRYSVRTHQNSHRVSHQTARDDLRKLPDRGLLIPGKDGRRDLFRVPEDLPKRLPV